MHFHGFKCILTLLLLNLSSSSALNDLSYDERGLMISSAECSSRKYSADTIYNAVRTGVDAIAYANRIGFEPLVKTYTPKKGEVLGLNGPYYVHRFWNDGTDSQLFLRYALLPTFFNIRISGIEKSLIN
ncbi:hypothetical protein EV44_g0435 [Erysiphe necator]|uniref:Uncharacterized protein n=1 Tax=Uncinula necator TaxID=52586 RepID=A0A0B1P252_UNCNE|nr:hypothetical protein EV44_g0435 [Erysiphe necator]